MRCRNFRRQSTQSEEMSRSRGRRDSCAQISDGTVATMTVETTAALYDTSTQTGKLVSSCSLLDSVRARSNQAESISIILSALSCSEMLARSLFWHGSLL